MISEECDRALNIESTSVFACYDFYLLIDVNAEV